MVKIQSEGSFWQELGYTLTEEMVLESGRLVNPTFMDYLVSYLLLHIVPLAKKAPYRTPGRAAV